MSEDVKTRILDAAERLFAVKGFEATSVRQICEEAGANVALVSYHFGGKEKLLFALLDRAFPSDAVYAEIDAVADPEERLNRFIIGYLDYANEQQYVQKIISQEILMRSARYSKIIETYTSPFWKRISRALQEGRAQGKFEFSSLKAAVLNTIGALLYPHMAPSDVMGIFEGEEEISTYEQGEATRLYILRGLGVNPKADERGSER